MTWTKTNEPWGSESEERMRLHNGDCLLRAARCQLAATAVVALAAGTALAGWIDDGRPGSWIAFPASEPQVAAAFPVLELELGGPWTDFELKATTNNFESLCYYVMSSGTNIWTNDSDVLVYFTDDYTSDPRKWRRAEPMISIGSQLADPINSVVEYAVVCPSHDAAGERRAWMRPDNKKLVWSFVRYDGIGLEMNATGTGSRWGPAVPVEWRAARIEP